MICRKRISAGLFIALWIHAAGCSYMPPSVRKPSDEEKASLRTGEKTIVLLRLAPRLDNNPVTPLSKAYDVSEGFWIFKADIERRDKPDRTRLLLSGPSREATEANWAYFILSPGAYWIGARGPGEAVRTSYPQLTPYRFFLGIPPGKPIVYAGTLATSCASLRDLFWRTVGPCGEVTVEDESETAREVASRDFGGYGPLVTALLRPQNDQAFRGRPGELLPLGILVKGAGKIGKPDWKSRGVSRATGLGGFTGDHAAAAISGGGHLGVAALLGYALYLPFGTVGGYIAGSGSAAKWGPCVEELGARIVEWSPPDALRASLLASLARRGIEPFTLVDDPSAPSSVDKASRPRSVMEVRILDVVFRECEKRWTFCPEMVIRGSVRDEETGRILFDETLVYTDPGARGSFSFSMERLPYEQKMPDGPRCIPIEEYCGKEGARLLLDGFEGANRALTDRMVSDLLGPPSE